ICTASRVNVPATIATPAPSLHDALPIYLLLIKMRGANPGGMPDDICQEQSAGTPASPHESRSVPEQWRESVVHRSDAGNARPEAEVRPGFRHQPDMDNIKSVLTVRMPALQQWTLRVGEIFHCCSH